MTTNHWLGTNSGDGNTDSNWSTGSKPVNGDTVYLDSLPANALTSWGGTPATLVLFQATDAYGNNPIGTLSAGLPLAATTTVNIGARCTFVNLAPTGTITTLVLNMPNGCDAYINGSVSYTTTRVGPGVKNLIVGSAPTLVTIQSASAATVITMPTGTATTTFIGAANLTSARDVTTSTFTAGSVFALTGAATATTINLAASTFLAQSSGAITTINALPGSFITPLGNASGSTGTITSLNLWSGAAYAASAPGAVLGTITNLNYVGPAGAGPISGS